MHGSQPGCFTIRSMLLEDFKFFFLVGWWKADEVKEDLFLYNTQQRGLNVVVTRILYQA